MKKVEVNSVIKKGQHIIITDESLMEESEQLVNSGMFRYNNPQTPGRHIVDDTSPGARNKDEVKPVLFNVALVAIKDIMFTETYKPID